MKFTTSLFFIVALICVAGIYHLFETRTEVLQEYIGYARRYGPTAKADSVRRVIAAYSVQLHQLRNQGDWESCANFAAGRGSVSNHEADQEFRRALVSLGDSESQDLTSEFSKEVAKSVRNKIWRQILRAEQLPDDLNLIARSMRSNDNSDRQRTCILFDDFYLYLLEEGHSAEMLPVGRLWLSTIGES
ncbi:MAG: hypothetical protein U0136_07430 [Bdellovibrionota bacterium]